MKITLHPYQLEFVFPFRIAHGIRSYTDAVFVELECEGVRAFGEATLPPYLPYTQVSTMACLSSLDISSIHFPFETQTVLAEINALHSKIEPPALAALEMALWALEAKMKDTSIAALLGIMEPDHAIRTYTLSVCDRKEMAERIAYGREYGFHTFKLKFNGTDDRRMFEDFRSLSDAPFGVDANQAWTEIDKSILFAKALEANGCMLIEQPFRKDNPIQSFKLKSSVGIPIIADEACQQYGDIDTILTSYSGVNVKLQKCGGIYQAYRMIKYARGKSLKVLIGCMSESVIGCSAGEILSPLCDWNDLDGSYLVKEVPFKN